MNSYKEFIETLQSMDLGKPQFILQVRKCAVTLIAPDNPALDEISNSTHWLMSSMHRKLKRQFDSETKKWVIAERSIRDAKEAIIKGLLEATKKVIDSKIPERTSLYKDLRNIAHRKSSDEQFLTNVIQILNYYTEAMTDSTCIKNTQGLLEILRKRYNGKSN